jgi:hypothetical protein
MDEEDGILVRMPNKLQRDTVVAITEILILNYPIWIVRQPTEWSHLRVVLTPVFRANSSDGVVDLADKTEHNIDFSKRDFIELLLLRLGTIVSGSKSSSLSETRSIQSTRGRPFSTSCLSSRSSTSGKT